jgi:activator of HSP90 ATPase
MDSMRFTRRTFTVGLASLLPVVGIAPSTIASIANPRPGKPADTDEITHTSEAIHQEVIFKAPRKKVYEALTDAKQFEKVVQLSAAVKSGMVPPGKPAEISRELGGAFSLFGGYISGRQLALIPEKRIVQAWRAGSWDPDDYSIANFVFSDQDANTKLIFDHTGFPGSQAQHLAEGWHVNYWEPLSKFLAQ